MFYYFEPLLLYDELGPLVLRLVLGVAFILHGYPKLTTMRLGFAAWLESLGIKPGMFWALVVGVVEFFGGITLVLGAFTQLAALLIAVDMLVAITRVKLGKVRFIELEKSGWELDLMYLAAAVALLFLGGGVYSLDESWQWRY